MWLWGSVRVHYLRKLYNSFGWSRNIISPTQKYQRRYKLYSPKKTYSEEKMFFIVGTRIQYHTEWMLKGHSYDSLVLHLNYYSVLLQNGGSCKACPLKRCMVYYATNHVALRRHHLMDAKLNNGILNDFICFKWTTI
jgi:hypothetical protein